MKTLNRQKGNSGEDIASEYLQKNGWQIVQRNFQTRWGEIDIIVLKDDILSFVEVKTKTSDNFGSPEQMINRNKIFQIQKTAEMFLTKNKKLEKSINNFRIDVIAIVLDNNELVSLNYYENVGAEFV